MEKAFQGNSPATKMLLDLMLKWGILDTTVVAPAFDVSEAKEALMRKFELACRTAPNAENSEKTFSSLAADDDAPRRRRDGDE